MEPTSLQPVPLVLLLIDDSDASTQRFKEDLISLGYHPTMIQIRSRDALTTWLHHSAQITDVVVSNHRVKNFGADIVLDVLADLHLNIPVVLLTDGTTETEIAPLLRAGAIGFITLKEVKRLIPMIEEKMRSRKELTAFKDKLAQEYQAQQSVVAALEELKEPLLEKKD